MATGSSGCGSPVSEAKTPIAARALRDAVAPCDARRDGWTSRDVFGEGDRLFAVGFGDAKADAQAHAQQAMTQWLGVRISSKSVDWSATSGGRDETKYQSSAETYASHSLSACKLERSCGNGEQVVALVSCTQGSGFERQMRSLGRELGAKVPRGTTLLLPGVNEDQFVTRLGELALTTLRPGLEESMAPGVTFATPASLRLTELRSVLREQHATHWLALDVHLIGTDRLQVVATVRDAQNDLEVPEAHASRTVSLEPELLALSDARGPLFAQRTAADVAALGGREGVVSVAIAPRLDEGKNATFEIRAKEEGYVVAYVIDELGALTRVVPSPLAPEAHLLSNAALRVPTPAAERAGYTLRPCAPPGQPVAREQLKVVWSKAPLDLPGQPSRETGGYVVLEPGATGDQRKLVAALEALRARGVPYATALATYVIEGSPEGARICAGH
jgi:hypothetical protein